jgi:hypothetical protein
MQMAPIKSAAPMPKQTMPRATLSATFIDCPPTGNIPPVRAHVAEGQRLPIFLAHLGDSNPCFRRERNQTVPRRTSANMDKRNVFNCLAEARPLRFTSVLARVLEKFWRNKTLCRAARSLKLETRTARAKLPMRRAPYYLKVAKGVQLGYYRGGDAGTWIARRYVGSGKYETTAIGITDDTTAADNVAVFDFWQAQDVLRRWAERGRLADHGIVRTGPYTVRAAVDDYLTEIAVEKRASALKSAQYVFNASVLPKLGHLLVERLTSDQITRWRDDIAASGKQVRTHQRADKPARRQPPASDDERRKRRATANRVLSMLKAALNRAYNAGRVPSDAAWRKVKPFKQANEPVVRYLNGDESRRLVNACEEDFGRWCRLRY